MPYTLLQITSVNNIDDVLDYSEDNNASLPKIIKEKNDGRYYMLIKKDYHSNYKARVILDQVCRWDDKEKVFKIGNEKYDIPSIFDIDVEEKNPTKWNNLTNALKLLDVRILDIYDDDLTEGMREKMKEKLN